MIKQHYNNIGMGTLAIASVMNHAKELPISKAMLILPFITHRALLSYLCRKTTKIRSIEKLIIERTVFFANFNRRFYDNLTLSINSIEFLNDIELISISNSMVKLKTTLEYDKSMGERLNKIYNSSENIAHILNENIENLYLNLRIQL